MRESIVRQLVVKDLQIMKLPAVGYFLGGMLAIAFAVSGLDSSAIVSFILFVSCLFGVGVHCAMQTVTEERREQNLPFIMSLPITIREYTSAKMVANLTLVGSIWLVLSAASYVIFIGDAMPIGRVPFVTIVLVGILLAYIIILATTLIFNSLAAAIIAMVAANLLTQAALWWISDLHGIRSTMNGMVPVWNTTALTVLGAQCGLIVGLIGMTFFMQSRKTDFLS